MKQPLLMRSIVRTGYHFFTPDDGWFVGFFPTEVPKYVGKIAH